MDRLEALENLLDTAENSILRVRFNNGDIFDLRYFAVAQDLDEDLPHCSAMIVKLVHYPDDVYPKLHKEGNGLFFMLNEVVEVRDAESGKVLFLS